MELGHFLGVSITFCIEIALQINGKTKQSVPISLTIDPLSFRQIDFDWT